MLDLNTKKDLLLKYLDETPIACKNQCVDVIKLGLEEMLAERKCSENKTIINGINGGVNIMIDRLPGEMICELYRIMQKKIPSLPAE